MQPIEPDFSKIVDQLELRADYSRDAVGVKRWRLAAGDKSSRYQFRTEAELAGHLSRPEDPNPFEAWLNILAGDDWLEMVTPPGLPPPVEVRPDGSVVGTIELRTIYRVIEKSAITWRKIRALQLANPTTVQPPADRLEPSAPGNSPEGNVASRPRRKPGRPTKIPDELKQRALAAQGGRARAQILYVTNYPTPQQVKNVSSILRHYRKKRTPNQG
jgi:hypothetical protein